MRALRPTLKAILLLPEDSFGGCIQIRQVKARIKQESDDPFSGADLSCLSQPLLIAANRVMSGQHEATLHKAATMAAGERVFEIRERGSGWRGAVILDDEGDPWLVYAAEHDKFHSDVASFMDKSRKEYWFPRSYDYKLRDKDEVVRKRSANELSSFITLVSGIFEAACNHGESQFDIPSQAAESNSKASIQVISDVTDAMCLAVRNGAEVCVEGRVVLDNPEDMAFRNGVARAVACIQPNQEQVYSCYQGKNEYYFEITTTLARVSQLSSLVAEGEEGLEEAKKMLTAAPDPQRVLHYSDRTKVNESIVNGGAVMSLCGVWFVPVEDEYSDKNKSVCQTCDKIKPLIDLLARNLR